MATSLQDDGAGDWTVAGLATHYSPEQWADIKAELAQRSRHHISKLHVADTAGQHKPYGKVGRLVSWWYGR